MGLRYVFLNVAVIEVTFFLIQIEEQFLTVSLDITKEYWIDGQFSDGMWNWLDGDETSQEEGSGEDDYFIILNANSEFPLSRSLHTSFLYLRHFNLS